MLRDTRAGRCFGPAAAFHGADAAVHGSAGSMAESAASSQGPAGVLGHGVRPLGARAIDENVSDDGEYLSIFGIEKMFVTGACGCDPRRPGCRVARRGWRGRQNEALAADGPALAAVARQDRRHIRPRAA